MTKIEPAQLVAAAEKDLANCFERIDDIALQNQSRVLKAFRNHRLTTEYFAERTGYGMDDAAREVIDSIFAEIYFAEAAAVRMQMVSGTHALACALLGNLKSGDRLAILTGHPYDTMEKVIGIKGDEPGSLKNLGVDYIECDVIPLLVDDRACWAELQRVLSAPTRIAYIQKSCGYSIERPTLFNSQIEQLVKLIREIRPDVMIMVDNCYGELVEVGEPLSAGADMIAGSLIKNPGGGLAISGGYFAGRKKFVDAALNRLTAPGIGGHLGLSYNQNRLLLQGMFLAPQAVANAVKGAQLFAHVFSSLGFEVSPQSGSQRGDIIQAIKFGNREKLVNFLNALQHFSPVDAHVKPEPAEMPGYEDQVVMAGGTFIEGSTIELSGDGPLRPPYVAFVQGGLTYMHVKLALIGLLELASSGDYQFL
ncbi:MAG: methionine gamma-lyase family protein [Candidatus Obscuribacterales bacterium]|nr:methionine gamma-lyase family protein [Candidatus Obscuribacterales bacterium]